MKNLVFYILVVFPALLNAQTTVKGLVTEQNSGNKPIPGVQIKALGSTPEQTDNAGLFQLVFTSKKPGDRIIVSEISKKGYEIVNKDVVNNWLIPGNPGDKTKIVMCPEGLIAQNTLKYYDISLDGLTKGYQNRIKELQKERDKAQIDAKTFGEQAKALADQFENQQKQLEELADKFARENFDDCSAIHRQAFEAFKSGNVGEAIRILESVNSEAEIAKAKEQKTKAENMKKEMNEMLVQSDSVINQNIKKLLFQADMYESDYRIADAERTYLAAVNADTTNFESLYSYAWFLKNQYKHDESNKWYHSAIRNSRSDIERNNALSSLAFLQMQMYQFEQAEANFKEVLSFVKKLYAENPQENKPDLAITYMELGQLYLRLKQYEKSEAIINEAIKIRRELVAVDAEKYSTGLARSLSGLASLQEATYQYEKSEASFNEALVIYRKLDRLNSQVDRRSLLSTTNSLALLQNRMGKNDLAKVNIIECLGISRELAEKNPDAYNRSMSVYISNLATINASLGLIQESEANMLEAISIQRTLAKSNPQVGIPDLAIMLSNLAFFYQEIKEYQKSEATFQECIDLFRKLAMTNPGAFTWDLAANLYGVAKLYREMNKYEKADSCFTETLGMFRESAITNPQFYKFRLANILSEYSWLQYKTNLPAAIINTNEAIEILEQLVDSDSSKISTLAMCYGRMSRYELLAKNFKEAEKYALKALSFDNKADHFRKNLAHSLLYQGKYKKALQIYTEIKDNTVSLDQTKTHKDLILRDFDEFGQAGITHPDVAKIRELLNQ